MTGKKKNRCGDRKVWHICRFHERYELRDSRSFIDTPLLYTKDFVRANDNESSAYCRQLMALRSKPDWLILRGAFAELKNIAGNMSIDYRGFLLNSNFEPASEKEIGRWLGVDEQQAKRIIADLEDVALIEQVVLPKFTPKKKSKLKKTKKAHKSSKAPAKGSGRTRMSTKSSVSARETLEHSGRVRNIQECSGKTPKSFKKKVKNKIKTKVKINSKAKTNEQIDNDNPKRKNNNNRQKSGRDNSNALEGERKHQDQSAATAPTTAPPIMPQESDARGSRVLQFARAPSGSVKHNQPQRLGEILEQMKHRYDPDAQQFGGDIYCALKLPWEPTSSQGKRELGCFAAQWMKAKAGGMDAAALEELRIRAIQEAGKLAKRRGKRGNISAIFCHIFKKMLLSREFGSTCLVV